MNWKHLAFCVTQTHTDVDKSVSDDAWKPDFNWPVWLKSILLVASNVWKVNRNPSWPPKLCVCLDRQNIPPLWSLSLYPKRVFKRGCGREGQHLSFLRTYVKHYTYCQILEGSCFLVKFPSKLIQPIRSSVGGWGSHKCDSGEPLSDPQLGSNNTAYPRPRHYHNTAGLLLTIQMEGWEDILIIEANESHKCGDRSWRRHLLKANIWSGFSSKNQGCPKHSQTWLYK